MTYSFKKGFFFFPFLWLEGLLWMGRRSLPEGNRKWPQLFSPAEPRRGEARSAPWAFVTTTTTPFPASSFPRKMTLSWGLVWYSSRLRIVVLWMLISPIAFFYLGKGGGGKKIRFAPLSYKSFLFFLRSRWMWKKAKSATFVSNINLRTYYVHPTTKLQNFLKDLYY